VRQIFAVSGKNNISTAKTIVDEDAIYTVE
jgi:hypothetical protein